MDIRKKIYAVLKIVIIFLSSLLFLVILNGKISLFMIVGALSITYIILHYWEKRFLAIKKINKTKVK
jgi:hypothetical protein